MTRPFILIIALLASLTSAAQSVRLVLQLDSSGNQNVKSIDSISYFYDPGMKKMDLRSYLHDGGEWAAKKVSRKNYHTMNGQYNDWGNTLQHFDGDTLLTAQYRVDNTGDTIQAYFYHYTNGHCDSLVNNTYLNGVFNNGGRRYLSYGTDGVTDELNVLWNSNTSSWDSVSRSHYTYVGGQNTVILSEQWSNGWSAFQRIIYTYTGNNIASNTWEMYTPGVGLVNSMRGELFYDSYDNMIDVIEYGWSNGAWDTSRRQSFTYDAYHNILSHDIYNWNGTSFIYDASRLYTYNAEHLVTLAVSGHWNNQVFIEDQSSERKSIYFYESLTASVGDHSVGGSSTSVFPNPTTNTLNIRSFTEQKEMFSVTIFDATGKSVKHWNEPPTAVYQKQVDVSKLPSGNYFIKIATIGGKASYQQFSLIR